MSKLSGRVWGVTKHIPLNGALLYIPLSLKHVPISKHIYEYSKPMTCHLYPKLSRYHKANISILHIHFLVCAHLHTSYSYHISHVHIIHFHVQLLFSLSHIHFHIRFVCIKQTNHKLISDIFTQCVIILTHHIHKTLHISLVCKVTQA